MIRAYLLGLWDGFRQPEDLTSGMTWEDDQRKCEAYDRGANAGQAIGRVYNTIRETY